MVNDFTLQVEADYKRAEAERAAAQERFIQTHGPDSRTSAVPAGESRTRGSRTAGAQPALRTAWVRLRTAVLAW
jgi:hypothetical protein